MTSQQAAARHPRPVSLSQAASWSSLLSGPSSHGPHRMAVIAWLHCAEGRGPGTHAPYPRPKLLTSSFMVLIALMAFITWPSSHGFIVLGRARVLTPTPRILVPSSRGLHLMALIAWPSSHGFIVLGRARLLCWQSEGARLTGFIALLSWPSSHGPHRMAVIAWFHCAWQGQGARLTSQTAVAQPPPVSLSQTAHFRTPSWSLLSWPSSHGPHRMASSCLAGRGCSAWQREGARLTGQKAAPRHPSCSLHRLHGLHRSHGLHRMASSCLEGRGCSVD